MITTIELESLLADLESDRVERTVSERDTDKFSKAVCAFANDMPQHRQPGYLIVGVRDDGSLAGLKIYDSLLQNLAALRSDGNILPLPALTVEKVSLPHGDVAVVTVQPSDLPPVRYRGQIWIRVGSRRAIASEQEERLLTERRVSNSRSFDASSCTEAGLSDIGEILYDDYRRKALAPEVIAANHRSIEEQMASLRFYDLKRDCPSYASIILFSKRSRFFLPGAYIQFLRFNGPQITDPLLDQAEIEGDVWNMLREVDVRIRANIQNTLKKVSILQEKLQPTYPESAVRELLLNAIVHRDYQSNTPVRFYWFSDHIEIQNAGGLYGEVTPQNFMTRNSYRNPVLAEAMKTWGYVNRYGYGIQNTQKLLADNGQPPAEFIFDLHTVAVTIRESRSDHQ